MIVISWLAAWWLPVALAAGSVACAGACILVAPGRKAEAAELERRLDAADPRTEIIDAVASLPFVPQEDLGAVVPPDSARLAESPQGMRTVIHGPGPAAGERLPVPLTADSGHPVFPTLLESVAWEAHYLQWEAEMNDLVRLGWEAYAAFESIGMISR